MITLQLTNEAIEMIQNSLSIAQLNYLEIVKFINKNGETEGGEYYREKAKKYYELNCFISDQIK